MSKATRAAECEKLARQGDKWNGSLVQFLIALLGDAGSYLPGVLSEHYSSYKRKKEDVLLGWASQSRAEQRGPASRAAVASDLVVVEARFNRKLLQQVHLLRGYFATCKQAGVALPQYPTDWIYKDFPVSHRLVVAEYLSASAVCDFLWQKYNLSKGKKAAGCIRRAERARFRRRADHRPASMLTPAVASLQAQPSSSQEYPVSQSLDTNQTRVKIEPQSYLQPLLSSSQGYPAVQPLDTDQTRVSPETQSSLQAQPSSSQEYPVSQSQDTDQTRVKIEPQSYQQPRPSSSQEYAVSQSLDTDQTRVRIEPQSYQQPLPDSVYWACADFFYEYADVQPLDTDQTRVKIEPQSYLQPQPSSSQEYPVSQSLNTDQTRVSPEPQSYLQPQPSSSHGYLAVQSMDNDQQPWPSSSQEYPVSQSLDTEQTRVKIEPQSYQQPLPDSLYWSCADFFYGSPEVQPLDTDLQTRVKIEPQSFLQPLPSSSQGYPAVQPLDTDQTRVKIEPQSYLQPLPSSSQGYPAVQPLDTDKTRIISELWSFQPDHHVICDPWVPASGPDCEGGAQEVERREYYWGAETNPRFEELFGIMDKTTSTEPESALLSTKPDVPEFYTPSADPYYLRSKRFRSSDPY